MGGHKYGKAASYIVVNALSEYAKGHRQPSCRNREEKFSYIQAFQEMINQVNQRIHEFAIKNDAAENMGATLSGVIVFSDEVAPFNIGDSSTYIFEKRALRKLTIDDNEAAMFENTPSEKLEASGKRLTKYFGLPKSSGVLTATISKPVPLKMGQIYLIASDGLTDCLSQNSIAQIIEDNINNMESAVNQLLKSSLRADGGGRDNITIVMIKIAKTFK
jgi:protein phosphatase